MVKEIISAVYSKQKGVPVLSDFEVKDTYKTYISVQGKTWSMSFLPTINTKLWYLNKQFTSEREVLFHLFGDDDYKKECFLGMLEARLGQYRK